jgi:hypothetical protein
MTDDQQEVPKDHVPFRFHFFEISFTPYKDNSQMKSTDTIYEVAKYLSVEGQKGRGVLVDKHEGRSKDLSRPLFITSCYFKHLKDKIIVGSIALLRKGRIPRLKPAETFSLVDLDISKGEIAEETHFFIDYSSPKAVMCVEYNHEGPRATDLEFYFRIVARDKLQIAKATLVDPFMDVSIDKTLSELKNVLQFEIKIQPEKLRQLDHEARNQYLSGMAHLGQIYNPNFIRVEALFQTPGKQYESSQLNTNANGMAKKFLKLFKEKPVNADLFDSFVLRYQTEDGKEEFFNLLKGKKEVIKFINPRITKKGSAYYDIIKEDFSSFVNKFR